MKLSARIIGGTVILLAAALSSLPASAEEQVVVSSWGGSFQDAEREAIFKDFEKETGIKVIEDSGPSRSKIQAMVQANNTQWDVAEPAPGDFALLVKDGLLEKIDYSLFDKETLDALAPGTAQEYGAAGISYSRVIAWNTDSFPNGGPQTWEDFWNVEKFPGLRIMDTADYANSPIEYALMADGVPMDKLYPIDLDRAYASLEELRPHVVKWANSAAMGPEALVAGEADIAVASSGRVAALKNEGAPVDFTYNQGALVQDYLVVPKGAKNKENAMKFIAFYFKAKGLARLAEIQPYGSPNLDAFKYMDEGLAKTLPSYPENAAVQLRIDYHWWASVDPATGKSWRDVNSERWQDFVAKAQ
jgi:putative spermidine/putrescine transport system substrate-binding protein